MRWFTEKLTPYEYHSHKLKRIITSAKTCFQNVLLADSHSFGKCLVLDGETQSALFDEYIYHECLVQPALLLHPSPETALIMGGGEGGTSREILKAKSIERVVMVDIDAEVVNFCKRYFKEWHRGSFEHPNLRLLIQDARKYIEETHLTFDLIFSDLPSPNRGSPANLLYTVEFYRLLSKRLNKNGIFAMQAGSANLLQINLHAVLFATLRKVFPVVRPYYAYIPSYDVPWAFLLCSKNPNLDPMKMTQPMLDRKIRTHLSGSLKFMDGQTWEGLFRIPKIYREHLKKQKKIFTKQKHFYYFA
ncbi:MAG: fused MFS/spermidine synthase [Elusimicrobia bacterium]|nr:fused MFS/spermidine synthase [Elusimicrobiota bacterium]